LKASLGWVRCFINQSEMARSSECTGSYAQKELDIRRHCQRRLISTTKAG
jgi:hypothetical protein